MNVFRGRHAVIVTLNGLMGFPSVVVGLVVYLLLSRAGPLGSWGLLFTPTAMVIAQTILVTPIIAALSRQVVADSWQEYDEQLRSLGDAFGAATTLVWDTRFSLVTVVLAGFGRAASEVGAVMIVGGNIDGVTRVMTTTIALETSKGDLPLALGLGIILISVVLLSMPAATSSRETARGGTGDRRGGYAARHSVLPLRLDDVSFVAGSAAIIQGLSATFEAGSRTIILGPNGAGKSVLLRLCHGLLSPTAGPSNGTRRNCRADRGARRWCSSGPWCLRRTALGNVMYALKLAGAPLGQREAGAWDALRKVGLDALASDAARVLSGGEQQRLALARVWALRPEILFLDEPTASLDPGATHEIERIIGEVHAAGTKIVMVTHNLWPGAPARRRDPFLHQGRLVERARPTASSSTRRRPRPPVSRRRIAMVITRRVFLALLVALAAIGTQAQVRCITVASTTSTEQSGLFGFLLPIFEKETGSRCASSPSVPARPWTSHARRRRRRFRPRGPPRRSSWPRATASGRSVMSNDSS